MPIAAPGEEHLPSLALVNTRLYMSSGLVDRIDSARTASEWLHRQGLLQGRATLTGSEFQALLQLRKLVFKVFTARIGGTTPSRELIGGLNDFARGAPAAPCLVWPDDAPPLVTLQLLGGNRPTRAFALLARDAMDAVAGERGDTLLECEAPGCVRLLEKDHPRRRWCSTGCGDRVRAARYYARHKQGA